MKLITAGQQTISIVLYIQPL